MVGLLHQAEVVVGGWEPDAGSAGSVAEAKWETVGHHW